MKKICINIGAVLIGLLIGGLVNFAIVMLSAYLTPLPEGIDPTNMEELAAIKDLMKPYHYLFPFLAHALGTFVGAWLTATIAANHKVNLAMFIGVFFLLGGIANVLLLPVPVWFILIDITFAYLPTARLAARLGSPVK